MHPTVVPALFAFGLPHGAEWLYILVFGVGGSLLWVFALMDCLTHESSEGNTKIVWILVILLLGFFGALIYFFVRRPQRLREMEK